MIDLGIVHHFSHKVYAKQMLLPGKHYAETHEHNYDHMSILATGAVLVTIDGKSEYYAGPSVIHIKAGQKHRIEALTDAVWFCVHGTEETDPDKIDLVLIKER